MKFEEAYEIAINECGFMKHATKVVIDAMRSRQSSPCYQFSIGDEAFFFGFDGVDLHKGKHTPARAATLIERGETWRVRN